MIMMILCHASFRPGVEAYVLAGLEAGFRNLELAKQKTTKGKNRLSRDGFRRIF
jgi:hypothetical protein